MKPSAVQQFPFHTLVTRKADPHENGSGGILQYEISRNGFQGHVTGK
jgi:hypothetical protein